MEQRCRTDSEYVFGLLRWQNGLDDSVSARQMWTPPFLAYRPFVTVGFTAESSVRVPKIFCFHLESALWSYPSFFFFFNFLGYFYSHEYKKNEELNTSIIDISNGNC